jgi:uncharacterized protein YozE (UPF0346 family)
MTNVRVINKDPVPFDSFPNQCEDLEGDELISFITTQIRKLKKYSTFENSGDVKFYELNKMLCEYQNLNLGLISLYTMTKADYLREQKDFDAWWDEKYVTLRNEMNPKSALQQKWLAAKEIEVELKVRFKKEYNERKDQLIILERKVSFLQRLLDSWAGQKFILNNLSKNLIAEFAGTQIDRSADHQLEG